MDALFSQIKELYAKGDDNEKRKIQGFVRELQVEFYTDWDVVMRLASGPLQVALIRTAINLGIFTTLTQSETPVKLSEIASKTGASEQLLARILRSMAAFGQIKETAPYEYAPNAMTKIIAEPNASGALAHLFDIANPCSQALPEFFADTNYQNITSKYHTPFQKVFNTELSIFEWLPQHPQHLLSLGSLMALGRPTNWIDKYPVEEKLGSLTTSAEDAVLVDIGGGFGQQAIAFRAKFPELPGRVVVQDIPSTLAGAQPVPGVEFTAHDFFTEQTIKGAKIYYLRHVLHDWPDEECIKILQNVIPAMGPESRLIIDDVVLPEMGVPWQAANMDLLMMQNLAGAERTRPEWDVLIDKAGLKILEVFQYDSKMQGVIITVPK